MRSPRAQLGRRRLPRGADESHADPPVAAPAPLATLELSAYPRRAVVMTAAAAVALAVDFTSKTLVIAASPGTLLFHTTRHSVFGGGPSMIVVLAACSFLACALPSRVVAVGAGVALGGAVGNLASRHLWAGQGGSPDFIPFGDGSTGNFADLFILTGGVAMLLGALLWLGWTAAAALRERKAGR